MFRRLLGECNNFMEVCQWIFRCPKDLLPLGKQNWRSCVGFVAIFKSLAVRDSYLGGHIQPFTIINYLINNLTVNISCGKCCIFILGTTESCRSWKSLLTKCNMYSNLYIVLFKYYLFVASLFHFPRQFFVTISIPEMLLSVTSLNPFTTADPD